jgi:hypothetical protein
MVLVGFACNARGQQLLIDQSNTNVPPFVGFRYWATFFPGAPPVGQEFVPSFDSLDFVDLILRADSANGTGTFSVSIHAGSTLQPALATSLPTVRNDGLERETHFRFDTPGQLTPGNVYAIGLVTLAADSGWGIADALGGYSSGRMLWRGEPTIQDGDLWFREGFVVPEPSFLALIAIGGLCVIPRGRNGTNKQAGPSA